MIIEVLHKPSNHKILILYLNIWIKELKDAQNYIINNLKYMICPDYKGLNRHNFLDTCPNGASEVFIGIYMKCKSR
jgi:hypothetical protein